MFPNTKEFYLKKKRKKQNRRETTTEKIKSNICGGIKIQIF